MKIKIISWNVRGDDPDERKVIKNFLRRFRADLVCLQETKVQVMNSALVRSLGVGRRLNWKVLEAEGSAGGILLLWDNSRISLVDSMVGVSPYRVCLEWSKTGSNGSSLECMDRLRIDLENPFGKSLDR